MFERRLRILLALMGGVGLLIVLRCAQLQVLAGDHWRDRAERQMQRPIYTETKRGSIFDVKHRELAMDAPGMEAAVDYRAIEENSAWLSDLARARLGAAYRAADRAGREKMLNHEMERVRADILRMWQALAAVSGKSMEELDEIKSDIRRMVEMRRRLVWYASYEKAMSDRAAREDEPWYREWRLGGGNEPVLDDFGIQIAEQVEAHVILGNISSEAHNWLKKRLERYPGLVIRPGSHRHYPYGSSACHVLGRLRAVDADDVKYDPYADDKRRQYFPADSIGARGIELLCEQSLRGARGYILKRVDRDEPLSNVPPEPGRDVRITLDIELQRDIERSFERVQIRDKSNAIIDEHEMLGAAVVIDVPTGEVRALASHPTYDLNRFDELYASMREEYYRQPMLNRATCMALEPGSTVKPMVGLAAIGAGIITVDTCLECKGFLEIDGKRQPNGRCWTLSKFGQVPGVNTAHHQIPSEHPHPTGKLTLADALQRSCNTYFEVCGDKLRLAGLQHWYSRFGLGRKTGIGIEEYAGVIPNPNLATFGEQRSAAWFSSIGQSRVLATPIQMANVAATIARDGVWLRPTIMSDPSDRTSADRVDLNLSREGLLAVKEGMWRAVNQPAGTAANIRRNDIVICAKTGTAEAHPLNRLIRDDNGKPILLKNGAFQREYPRMSTPENRNDAMPWYRVSGHDRKGHHAWFIGFAPREQPRIAFAVMVEYGGSGGTDAAPMVNALIDACIRRDYLNAGR